jgi:hypothetical protein
MIAYHKRIGNLEVEKYDLEYEVAKKDLEVRIFFRQPFPKINGTAEPVRGLTNSPAPPPQNCLISRSRGAKTRGSLNLD